ncbi:MAG: DEAD/DEAH box helicase [Saccharofermentans sp.]|jgi:ATP-dependent RNA helicase DeaD|nr:DEAD/DEAH box helicase [Mageeibacillus sp.]MCI1263527.1 DEAD/DEAH box helicase [Saccharofermentans sp.]MCI1274534.1 DEAD/DEAH box helicase [Saccharofermentans sp.]MCI2044135.1 DEAD/DEAH box helicase [Mageeibacillus sp.]
MSEEITFKDLGLSPEVMEALDKMGVTRPTTVQQKAIPLMMDNMSVIAKAPTGTGKTFAFGIPIIEYLNLNSKYVQALILSPTRELALQITAELKGLGKYIEGFKVAPLIGGQSMRIQEEKLAKNPQIIVATPGRLLDMVSRRLCDISQIYTLVLDEADEMLKMGFIKDIKRIIALTPEDRQTALFSATMPREIQDITWEFMTGAAEIDVMPKAEDHPNIDQYIVSCPEKDKLCAVTKIMKKENLHKVIVFCNTKNEASRVCEKLSRQGLKAEALHGDIGQGARNRVMDDYRSSKFDVLVATDVVARGIDVDDVEGIFNYNIPKENELYLHRIGRTARAGKSGKAFSLVAYLDRQRMDEIIRYTKVDPKPYEMDSGEA